MTPPKHPPKYPPAPPSDPVPHPSGPPAAHTRRRVFPVREDALLLPFLLEKVHGKSRNAVKSLLTNRQVLVNNAVQTRHDTPLRYGDTVTLLPPGSGAPPALPFPICYSDPYLLAIEKPPGLLSVATDRERTRTAYRLVSDELRLQDPQSHIYVVHRLDQDTSGLLLFAKSLEVKEKLQENWDSLVRTRGYLAVVSGCPTEREGLCRSWLRETKTHLVYSSETPCKDGKEAITEYRVRKTNGTYTLLELFLQTGRKNQIRVHMKDLGCPVVGDKRYGGEKSPIGRLCLHAHALTFTHPVTGETISLTSRKPRDFNRLFREGV